MSIDYICRFNNYSFQESKINYVLYDNLLVSKIYCISSFDRIEYCVTMFFVVYIKKI